MSPFRWEWRGSGEMGVQCVKSGVEYGVMVGRNLQMKCPVRGGLEDWE